MAPNSFDSDGLSRREIDEQSITPTGGIWQNVGYEYINNFYRIPYEVKYTYTTHFITEIGQSSGFGRALTGSSNVGFSQTTQASISATGWSVTLGLSVAETSSSATQIDYPRAATPRVAWEAKVLAFNADLHYHIRGELKDSNGAWTPDTTNNGGNWSNPTFLKSGYTSFFGKIVYKIYE
jgi:hypothetical protein